MNCTKCGAVIEEGEVFCPRCGAEIQLVPDFYSSETVSYAQKQKEREEKERERRKREERAEKAAQEKRRQDRKRRRQIWVTIGVLVVLAAAIFAFKSYQDMKNHNSFEYQLSRAETCYTNNSYEDALSYVDRAIELDGGSLDARVLRAQIYARTDETAKAQKELEEIIEAKNDYTAAYGPLIRIYESEGEPEKIKELLDKCNSDNIREKYSGYICDPPVFTLPEGEYDEEKELHLYTGNDSDVIYYTTDKTEPDRLSEQYTDPISLGEGTVTVKAVAINEKGVKSDTVSNTYKITLAPPDPPKITPASGSFSTSMGNTKIYVIVPADCKAYYAFDQPATPDDTLYEGPVDMPEGEHTFYAILVNKYGKVSVAGSATYVLTGENTDEE